MLARRVNTVLWACGLLLLAGPLRADVVRSPPKSCPAGHKPRTGHGGPYCEPPMPDNCPHEHLPRVNRSHAYCEPPPREACPAGSRWTSTSEDDTFCLGGSRCESDDDCHGGGKCVDSSLCVREERRRRSVRERVSRSCEDSAQCFEGEKCVKHKRCDPPQKRVASSASAAKPVKLPQPSPSSATAKKPSRPDGDDDDDDGETDETETTAKPKASCGSCAIGGAAVPWSELLFLAAFALLRRRRRLDQGDN